VIRGYPCSSVVNSGYGVADNAVQRRKPEPSAAASDLQCPATTGPQPSALGVSLRKRLSESFGLEVSFTAPPGMTMLFGASGAGKTTLLECISGLLAPDSGRVLVGDRVLFDSELRVNVPVEQRRVAYVFQTLALFPHMSVEENIAYGLDRLPADQRRAAVDTIVEAFRIGHARHRRPGQISGGERQRAALARALVTDPCVLLLDEPLSALDLATKGAIIQDLRGWNEAHRIPVLYVTHSRDEVFALGEGVLALEQGRVLAEGLPQEVLHAPRQESLAQAAGFENIFDASVAALHEDLGTMTCHIAADAHLEAPLGHVRLGDKVRIGVRAGDILLAKARPEGLSARNVLPGRIESLTRRDVTVIARMRCGGENGLEMEVHLTPGAQHSLELAPGKDVWLVIKTYSCHLLR
jgi:molybdate transport system ATP-binding protein